MQLNALFKHWSYRIIAPGTLLREKYEALKKLLQYDIACHEMMAEFQDLLHDGHREDFARIRRRFTHFSEQVGGMVESLDTMDPGTYASLKSYHKKFDFYIRFLLAPPRIEISPPFVFDLSEITVDNKQVGNKAKHLAVLQKEIGATVPQGFVISTSGYHYFIEFNDLRGAIEAQLAELDIHSPNSLEQVSSHLTALILEAEVPPDIEEALLSRYDSWHHPDESAIKVAVRSSAISEDGDCSFAGLYTTVLNVNREKISAAYRQVLSSKYSPEALFYRVSQGLGDEETAMSVLVQEMVAAEFSGVLYTRGLSTDQEVRNCIHLHVARGLGEQLVAGSVHPDCYVLTKEKAPEILSRETSTVLLSDGQVKEAAAWGYNIERYFDSPQDIEWAMDCTGQLYILQARALYFSRNRDRSKVVEDEGYKKLLEGCECASAGIASGIIFRLDTILELDSVPAGAVLVTRDAPPSLVKALYRISAVIAERGSRASHFGTVAREFGIPFLAGIKSATALFETGTNVTVDGNRGVVYQGRIESLEKHGDEGARKGPYHRILSEALKFITPLELVDPAGENFTPEGCRSMHDIIRFCHEKALHSMFTTGRPGTGRGALRLIADIPLDVYLFDVGGGIGSPHDKGEGVELEKIASVPFRALWRGLSHPGVQWKQKPFDWDAYDRIELAGGVPPKKDSFAFASYAVIGPDYLHFNIRFGYHFTIVDVMCGENSAENHCMLRFAGGGGDYEHLSLRIAFLSAVLERLEFMVEQKGDLLEAKLPGHDRNTMEQKLDMLGRLLGASKLMDMVLEDEQMVASCVEDFYKGRYSFSQEG